MILSLSILREGKRSTNQLGWRTAGVKCHIRRLEPFHSEALRSVRNRFRNRFRSSCNARIGVALAGGLGAALSGRCLVSFGFSFRAKGSEFDRVGVRVGGTLLRWKPRWRGRDIVAVGRAAELRADAAAAVRKPLKPLVVESETSGGPEHDDDVVHNDNHGGEDSKRRERDERRRKVGEERARGGERGVENRLRRTINSMRELVLQCVVLVLDRSIEAERVARLHLRHEIRKVLLDAGDCRRLACVISGGRAVLRGGEGELLLTNVALHLAVALLVPVDEDKKVISTNPHDDENH